MAISLCSPFSSVCDLSLLCLHVHIHVPRCADAGVCVVPTNMLYIEARVDVEYLLQPLFALSLEAGSFIGNHSLLMQLVWSTACSRNPVTASWMLSSQVGKLPPSDVGAGDLNSCPHTCTASALPTEIHSRSLNSYLNCGTHNKNLPP